MTPAEAAPIPLDTPTKRPSLGACHVCGADALVAPRDVAGLKGVTSDCKPWPSAGKIAACARCGLVQKPGTVDWFETIGKVYDAYSIYHQSANGAEQAVFDAGTGQGVARSVRLFERLMAECSLPERGRLLDIGCGNGVLLRSVSRLAPGWTLAGADLDDRHRATVEKILGVTAFYAGPAEEIEDRFDAITLQHTLEHVPQPVELLRHLGRLLEPGGVIFVQVPNIAENPFDLMVVDHASHFGPETARATVRAAGLQTHILATDWAPKELTVIASRDETPGPVSWHCPDGAIERAADGLDWLARTVADASEAASGAGSGLGLLGTSIAATWLANMLGAGVQFFVDEDESRIGHPFEGRPVVHPSLVPAGASVYVAFPSEQARRIGARLSERYPATRWLAPPVR